jgi:DNA-binding NtrC family response regulator
VRELRNAIIRAVALADGAPLRAAHLPAPSTATATTPPSSSAEEPEEPRARRRAPSAKVLEALLHQHEGNIAAVARELSCDAAQIYRWLKRFDLEPSSFRPKE